MTTPRKPPSQKCCAQCGQHFWVRGRGVRRLYCSNPCIRLATNQRRQDLKDESRKNYECQLCHALFQAVRTDQKFCSENCRRTSKVHCERFGELDYCPLPLCKCGRIATPPKGKMHYQKSLGRSKTCDICRQFKEQERNKGRGSSKSLLRRQVVKRGEKIKLDNLVIRDGFDCQICGVVLDWSKRGSRKLWPSLDHIVPITKGGEHTYDNSRMVHLGCNASKGNR